MKPSKTIFDIDSEFFELYFHHQLASITPQAKEKLPDDVKFKIFRKGGEIDNKGTSKLSFLAKIFVLWKALRKNIFIVVEGDDVNGLTIEQFVELKAAIKVRDYGIDRANQYLTPTATFVTGNKELMDSLAYLNGLSTSPAYRYLLRNKNSNTNKVSQSIEEKKYIARFLSFYESNRKKIGFESGVNISEWLVLIAIYHGNVVDSNTIWNSIYKYSFNSSKTKIKVAFGTLQNRGYMIKHGASRGTKIQITSLGTSTVNGILEKYCVNC